MNHLKNETSPYLLQHADNPVNWYPWGEEAIQLARKEDKPILLSIGYSACHWCHVMEHESFENQETAAIMNSKFICIKVDREERPDIDQIYMNFVQMSTGSGGWPLNVFLTPQLEPFYGGTYFPPEDRYGRPSWNRVLELVSDFYHNRKTELDKNLDIVRNAFESSLRDSAAKEMPDRSTLSLAARSLTRLYDPRYGGLGKAPKFPATQPLSFFLRTYHHTADEQYLNMVTHSLRKMAEGGIYDHIGGGFARYSVDEQWLVPHFEKMLYDNALLVPLYLDSYLITKEDFYLKIAEQTLAFIDREMRSDHGGFYSSLDADSEGEEGKFYVWTKDEVDELLGENSAIFCDYYDVTAEGNFEGKNILHIQTAPSELAQRFNLSEKKVHETLQNSRDKLLREREKRIRPGMDDKVLTSWNALMVSAFARAYQITRNNRYAEIIRSNIDFIRSHLMTDDGLLRSYNKDKARFRAYAEDYAFLIQALMDAYEALFDNEYLELAQHLFGRIHQNFWDHQHFGYFMAEAGNKDLIYRLKDEHDQSTPSATGVMALNLLRFYSLTEDEKSLKQAEQIFKKYATDLTANAYTFSSYLNALDFYYHRPHEIFIISPKKPDYKFYDTIFDTFLPNKVVIGITPESKPSVLNRRILQGKSMVNKTTTAYVCHNFSCSLPVTSTTELLNLIQK